MVNSKLSGANSFQATMEYCFGKSGLIAISVSISITLSLRSILIETKGCSMGFVSRTTLCLDAVLIRHGNSAFGGMIAFCIIVGDTIPHVMTALFPSLPGVPFLWLLTDRRAVIIIFILGISYPLSLYRDIAKVISISPSECISGSAANPKQLAKASTLALVSMLIIIVTVISQGVRIPADLRGQLKGSLLVNDGFFQAIGVISFGNNLLYHLFQHMLTIV